MKYFAYGSNLNYNRLKKRLGDIGIISKCELLNDYTVKFWKKSKDGSGKATLVKHSGKSCYGTIYDIPDDKISVLDKLEGLNYGYDKINLTLSTDECFTYIANNSYIDMSLKPFRWYMYLMLDGAITNNFSKEYIEEINKQGFIEDSDNFRCLEHYIMLNNSDLNTFTMTLFTDNKFKFHKKN